MPRQHDDCPIGFNGIKRHFMVPLKRSIFVGALIIGMLRANATAATVPFFENFDGYAPGNTTPSDFTEFLDADWRIASPGGNNAYETTILAKGARRASSASVNLTNVNGQDFTISTTVVVGFDNSPSGGPQNRVALVAFGSDPNLDAGTNYKLIYLLREIQTPFSGGLFLVKNSGGTNSYLAYPASGNAPVQGGKYTITLHGGFVNGTLYLDGAVSDGQKTVRIKGSDPNPLIGSYFGFWNLATAVQVASTTAAYDDFSVRFESFPSRLANLSARINIGADEAVGIGGFIISGNAPKSVLLRGIGPSLTAYLGPPSSSLPDPVLELHASNGSLLATNDNWRDTQQSKIQTTRLQPSDDRESVILTTLGPGAYTAILRDKNNTTGIGLIEAYDLSPDADSKMANLSARGFVGTGNDVMIAGLIPRGDDVTRVILRALGPSLQSADIADFLADPVLELHDSNGTLVTANDDWRESQESEIQATGLAPASDKESAIVFDLPPENYTAIVRGKDNATGLALFETYRLN
jgi:hypothetical protein